MQARFLEEWVIDAIQAWAREEFKLHPKAQVRVTRDHYDHIARRWTVEWDQGWSPHDHIDPYEGG